jgi:large subunit ribosomal protein L26e
MDKDRKKILERRAKGKELATGKVKGKHTEETVAMETA